jgi:twitching motility protein PilT
MKNEEVSLRSEPEPGSSVNVNAPAPEPGRSVPVARLPGPDFHPTPSSPAPDRIGNQQPGETMKNFNLDAILEAMLKVSERVSDLNFSVGKPPQVEVDGQLTPVNFPGLQRLSPFQTETIVLHMLRGDRDLTRTLLTSGSTDLSYSIPGKTRFRVNVFSQRGTYAIVLRVIPEGIPTIEQLGLPGELQNVAKLKNGVVLVTGPTGSGKSTTLAAIINKINNDHAYHIITIEDPVEFMHKHIKSTVNQREVGSDTKTFSLALRAALRQAPKVILIGEMRDVETIEIAMEAAETGHLVLSTLHTIDASKTVDRIVGVFPKEQEQQVRTRFAQSFRYVISQRLVPKIGGGRQGVLEILKSTMRTRDYVLKGETDGKSLTDAMHDGGVDGMQTFDDELEKLWNEQIISKETALVYASNPTNLALRLTDEPESAKQKAEAEGGDMLSMLE